MVESDDTGILPCIVGVAASSYITLCNSVTIPCFKNVNDVFLSHPTLRILSFSRITIFPFIVIPVTIQ